MENFTLSQLCGVNMAWNDRTELVIQVVGERLPDKMTMKTAKAFYHTAQVVWFEGNFVCLAVT